MKIVLSSEPSKCNEVCWLVFCVFFFIKLHSYYCNIANWWRDNYSARNNCFVYWVVFSCEHSILTYTITYCVCILLLWYWWPAECLVSEYRSNLSPLGRMYLKSDRAGKRYQHQRFFIFTASASNISMFHQ